MRRIITVTRCTHHFVDVLTDEETKAEARTKALAEAGTDHRFWDIEQEETPWVLAVRSASELEDLIERSRSHVMTPAEREAQRRSFAYGNAHISNPNVTREMVDSAAERIAAEKSD